MKQSFLKTALLVILLSLYCNEAMARDVDRIIAYVNETAITERELEAQHKKDIALYPSRAPEQTLEAMINTSLMLQDARKLRLVAENDAELLKKYLELKIRTAVLVSEKEITAFFRENRERFGNRSLRELRSEIRTYLEESRYNIVLKEHIAALREAALIKILER